MSYIAYRHAHHAGSLIEFHSEDYYEQRMREFDEIKAKEEPPWKIERRKKLFGPVKGSLSPRWDKAEAECKDELEALHKAECEPDCPWNGVTIFPEEL